MAEGVQPKRRNDIDCLRAVAVLVVILYHADVAGMGAGFIGVDIFFVISGYLMARILITNPAPPDIWTFYLRRIRRVMPLAIIVVVASVPAAWLLLMPGPLKDHGQAMAAAVTSLSNLLFWWEAGYFELGSAQKPLLHTWSLGVEAQFYLVFPLILMTLGRRVVAGMAVLAGLSFLAALLAGPGAPEAVFYLLPFRLWELLAGALGACVVLHRGARLLGLLGAALMAAGLVVVDHDTAWPWLTTLLPVAGAMLVLMGGFRGPEMLAALGRWSYGLYLWHWPVFVFWQLALPEMPVAGHLVWMLPALIGLSWLTYHLIEQPFQRGQVSIRVWAGLPAGALVGLGAALHLTGGMPERLSPAAHAVHVAFAREAMPCHNVTAYPTVLQGEICLLGDPTSKPLMVLVGDSHAGHLAAELDRELRRRGLSAMAFTRSWCAPLPGLGTTAPGRGRDCRAYIAAVFDRIAATPPPLIVLAAQWGSYESGGRPGVPDVSYEMAGHTDGFAVAMEVLRDRLAALPATKVILASTPEFPVSVPDRLMRKAHVSDRVVRALVPLDYVARNGGTLAALRALDDMPETVVLYPETQFCKAGLCQVADPTGAPYFRDSNHLTNLGAVRVVSMLGPYLDRVTPAH